jgi:hypothetical protein
MSFFREFDIQNIVTCIPIARQGLGKRIPATTNISNAKQLCGKHAFVTIEEAVFSM